MASWRFQGAKHHPNQNKTGSFQAFSVARAISQERLRVMARQAQQVLPQVVLPSAQVLLERTLQSAAVRSD